MPQARRTVMINRPPEQVFAFLADPSKDPTWRPIVKEIAADGPMREGASIHQTVKGPGGRGLPSDLRVTAYEPARRYAFKVTAGPVHPEGEYRFAAAGSGTEVSLSLKAELTGLKKLLLSRAVQRSMDSEVAALERAKALIEAS